MLGAVVFLLHSATTALAEPLQPRRAALRARAEAYTLLAASRGANAACPCKDASLCAPIAGSPARDREVYGFGGGNGSGLDFSRVTTVAWGHDDILMCAAHKAGARVVLAAPQPEKVFLKNESVRAKWVKDAVRAVVNAHADGLVFDWESPCAAGCKEMPAYALLIGATRTALRARAASYQVSTCVAWSPDSIDGRDYDVVALAAQSDLLYVMDYDTRSQVFDACLAAANAPFFGMVRGLQRYTQLGVSPSQLVLGVPWYGYRYPCVAGTARTATYCPIRSVPFRGVNCSDAAGREIPYSNIMQSLAAPSSTGRQWDSNQGAPYFNAVEPTDGAPASTVQYWYDDPQSLAAKYAHARQVGVRGVGPFTFTDAPLVTQPKMWASLDAFLKPAARHTPPMAVAPAPASLDDDGDDDETPIWPYAYDGDDGGDGTVDGGPCTGATKQKALYLHYDFEPSLSASPALDIAVEHEWNSTSDLMRYGKRGVFAAQPIGTHDGLGGYAPHGLNPQCFHAARL